MSAKADKGLITRSNGETVEAMEPVIVSASRSTDIPAFHAKWFVERLRAGYCVWYNPFNQKPSYVSFKKTRAIVFWTKNARPLMRFLDEIDASGIHYYFQYSLNDYDAEGFEPNLKPLAERIETFRELSSRIVPARVIWRFDPIIMTPALGPRGILTRIWNISKAIKGCTNKLVVSFIDVAAYRKVQNNLVKFTDCFTRDNVLSAEPTRAQIDEICEGLAKIRDYWHEHGWDFEIATCAEKVDLDKYGIRHNKCVDDELLRSEFGDDAQLMEFLTPKPKRGARSEATLDLFVEPKVIPIMQTLKDKGQRDECGCVQSKDIGMYNTCRHFCVYCYANTSRAAVENQMKSFAGKSSSERESIAG
ncbi:MAG TPA: hypothetical protein DEO49_05990 [Sutterella sp.]|nr:hypothetical protein [Sutterella sp.]